MAVANRTRFFINSCFSIRSYKVLKQRNIVFAVCNNVVLFKMHNSSIASKITPKIESVRFDSLMKLRRDEARRTVVVEVKSNEVAKSLLAKESENVTRAYFYENKSTNTMFLLMEFKSQNRLVSFMSGANYCNGKDSLPVFSHFLKFSNSSKSNTIAGTISVPLIEYSQRANDVYFKTVLESKDVSEQMQNLYEETKLCDIQSRFRFLICKQVEDSFLSLLPLNQVKPFGSSVNGFGNINSDADMVLLTNPNKNKQSELTFQENTSFNADRDLVKKFVEIFGDVFTFFVPGCSDVTKIPRARVPIIKFHHRFTGLECDLAAANDSALVMSEILYLLGEYDKRVRPLVFTIFRWAKAVGVTNSIAGSWFTNFQLTLMVIFYLQQMKKPILPSLNELRIDGGGGNLFVEDVKSFPSLENDQNLCELLKGFFYFYESFTFKEHGLSINKGSPVFNSINAAVYIENPLEVEHNVSKNVSYTERKKFVQLVASALYHLERGEVPTVKHNWGILKLFHDSSKEKPNYNCMPLFGAEKKPDDVIKAEYETKTSTSGKFTWTETVKKKNPRNEPIIHSNKKNKIAKDNRYKFGKL